LVFTLQAMNPEVRGSPGFRAKIVNMWMPMLSFELNTAWPHSNDGMGAGGRRPRRPILAPRGTAHNPRGETRRSSDGQRDLLAGRGGVADLDFYGWGV
jgi:hypothetical protein